MNFEDPDNHFAFILLTIIIFFSISMIILIPNYMNVPKASETRGYFYGTENIYGVNKPFSWDIDLFDEKISNIEHILIYIPMLWGMLRLIDLGRFLENYKKK
jgi:hypothetical protein